ncbi:hypothetical protein B0H10DRAFT_1958929 [Mycena sp. CBHHK59/15]|nr:hypothetical protein B0H10DRAFT_1958929 [Mycena sp. CBHHK59/15]
MTHRAVLAAHAAPSRLTASTAHSQNGNVSRSSRFVQCVANHLYVRTPSCISSSVDAYAKILSTLDSLGRVLGDADHIEAPLKAFKQDLLAEISASSFRTPVASYASAASSLPSPSSPATPPPRAPAAKTHEVTIVVDKSSDILSLPLPEIKARVEKAILATGIEKLKGVELRGIKVLPPAGSLSWWNPTGQLRS